MDVFPGGGRKMGSYPLPLLSLAGALNFTARPTMAAATLPASNSMLLRTTWPGRRLVP